MKKVFTLISAFAFVAMIACGPSAEEKAKAEQMAKDSAAAAQATADSLAKIESDRMAAEKMMQDSINAVNKAMQDSMSAKMMEMDKKMNAKPKVKTQEQKMKEDKKVFQNQKG